MKWWPIKLEWIERCRRINTKIYRHRCRLPNWFLSIFFQLSKNNKSAQAIVCTQFKHSNGDGNLAQIKTFNFYCCACKLGNQITQMFANGIKWKIARRETIAGDDKRRISFLFLWQRILEENCAHIITLSFLFRWHFKCVSGDSQRKCFRFLENDEIENKNTHTFVDWLTADDFACENRFFA